MRDRLHSGLSWAGVLLFVAAASTPGTGVASAQTDAAKPKVTIYAFAMADASARVNDPAKLACPAVAAEIKNVTPEELAGIVSAITAELKEKLADKYDTQQGGPETTAAEGSLVIAGCLTEIDGGNARKRLIGAGMGASLLKAHVQISRMTGGKAVVLQETDEESKGRNFGVGSGMLINAMRAKRTSVEGDGGNLADKVVKALKKVDSAH